MKILLVTEYFYPEEMGGGEKSAFLLAKSLAKRNIDVSVLTSKLNNLRHYEEIENIKIYRRFKTGNANSLLGNVIRVFFFYNSAKKEIKKFIKEQEFDVIHCPNQTSGILLKAVAKAVKNKKIIATINGVTSLCPKGNLLYKEKSQCYGSALLKCAGCILQSKYIGNIKWPFFLKYNPFAFLVLYLNFLWRKKALYKIQKFIAYSEHIKSILIKHGISKNNIKKIPALVEIEKNTEVIPEIKNITNKIIVSSLSSLHKLKGVDLLIKGFAKIKNKDCILVIAGDGSEKDNLIKLAKELNIKDKIIFLGKLDRPKINYLYKKSNIVALTSLLPEAFSRICLESAFCGIPVLATSVGGNADYIIEGKNGFLVAPDEDSIAQKLELMIKNEKLRKKLIENTKKIYKENYKPDKVIEKIIELYNN